jgi:DNA-binding CsgD family transcriptional regulator
MRRGPALEALTGAIVELCRSGLPAEVFRDRVLVQLGRAVPFDAVFWAAVDPATLLFTQLHQQEIPAETVPYFVHNEFCDDDVNKWAALARERSGVRTLVEATAGDMAASARYRDVFRPLGLGDELRAVLRVGGACWGYLCLHRGVGVPFSAEEVRYVHRLAPHLAGGIRAGLLVGSAEPAAVAAAPGLVVVAPDGSLASATDAGGRWLAELGDARAGRCGLPVEVGALAAWARRPGPPGAGPPTLKVRTAAGRWVVLHASRLPTAEADTVAVIIQEASAAELAPVLMAAYRLTAAEQVVTRLVCRGLSTRELAERLRITPHTLQDHLKSIFDKVGVRSRRALVAAILREQYLPRAAAGHAVGASGFFAPPGR